MSTCDKEPLAWKSELAVTLLVTKDTAFPLEMLHLPQMGRGPVSEVSEVRGRSEQAGCDRWFFSFGTTHAISL